MSKAKTKTCGTARSTEDILFELLVVLAQDQYIANKLVVTKQGSAALIAVKHRLDNTPEDLLALLRQPQYEPPVERMVALVQENADLRQRIEQAEREIKRLRSGLVSTLGESK